MRKQLDARIPTLIRNGIATGHRSLLVLVGDHGRDQVVNLHYLLSQSRVSARPRVLWCYKKELGFTTHRKKREAKIKKKDKNGEPSNDPFELFVGATEIRYCYYKETHKILGQTYGMLVLQDFEALTPNLLARTIETVEGGGVVVLLLRTMTSLRQLYSLGMDAHTRFRSSAAREEEPVARFNERFLLSLGASPACLLLDDELNVLPLSRGKDLVAAGPGPSTTAALEALRSEVKGTKVVGELLRAARTRDQGAGLLSMLDVLSAKGRQGVVALTAARGRGKSAALGLSMAAAIAYGYSNIFVTSPSPENLATLFEFLLKGLDALGYQEVQDWDLVRGAPGSDLANTILRVNLFRDSRQTVQYIAPQDARLLGSSAELVVVDEAAAIPLPTVRTLMGRGEYLVFLSSTIDGYEGTGRSLSLKLIDELRTGSGGLKEVSLHEPIRYAAGDPIESWLHELLCLDARVSPPSSSTPHPSACELFLVNRDTLFSYHPSSEAFLRKVMALYVASHYKNSPNDLQLMSDAPGQRLFVLLQPGTADPLAVVQVALEGHIARQTVLASLARGVREAGDLIPWLLSTYYQDLDFASELSGARVVRVAVHPDYARMGYGSRAIELVHLFYEGGLFDADARPRPAPAVEPHPSSGSGNLLSEEVGLRDARRLPALLQRLPEQRPESLDWFGVSYGLTSALFSFWSKLHYTPLYVRQTANETTGEYTCVQVRAVGDAQWLGDFAADFRRRFCALLAYKFRDFSAGLALAVTEAASTGASSQPHASPAEIDVLLSAFDLKRLEAYGNNLIELYVVQDLLPAVAALYFQRRLADGAQLSAAQAALLLAIGLQHKTLADTETELGLPQSQLTALLTKAVARIAKSIRAVQKAHLAEELPSQAPLLPVNGADDAKPATTPLPEDATDLAQYRITDAVRDWSAAERQVQNLATKHDAGLSTTISVPSATAASAEAPTQAKRKGRHSSQNGKKPRTS